MPRPTRSCSTRGKSVAPARGARATPPPSRGVKKQPTPSPRGVKKQPMKPASETRRRGGDVQQEFPVAQKNINKTKVGVKFPPSGECEPLNNNISKRSFRVPLQLLGRDLDDPTADAVAGCRRRMQKPRLGVRVPNLNLTSQIITYQELCREVLERSKKRSSELIYTAPFATEGNSFLCNSEAMARRLFDSLTGSLSGGTAKVSSSGGPLGKREVARLGCSSDPTLERELALKQLEELPTRKRKPNKRKASEAAGREPKPKVVTEAPQFTPKELALKQLAEIQTRKPRKKI